MRFWMPDGVQTLGGLLLLVWGMSLALSGLGLTHFPAVELFNRYWPTLLLGWAVVGLLFSRPWGTGAGFYLLVIVGAGLLLLSSLHVPGLNFGDLAWALAVFGLAFVVIRGSTTCREKP